MKKRISCVFLAMLPAISQADEITDIYLQRAKAFIASKPIITQPVDEKGLVDICKNK